MRKNTITEPKFGKIFAVRFFVSLLIFSILAAYCLYKLDDLVWNKVDTERSQCLKKIVEVTQKLSKDKPGSEQYERYMGLLKIYMAYYQTFNHSYVEVTLNKQTISVGDTADFQISHYDEEYIDNEDYLVKEYFFIEDISYLEPLYKYMDGKLDEKEQVALNNKWGRDPLFEDTEQVGKLDKEREYKLVDAYVNRKQHTFIPGQVRVYYMNKEYTVDCTPADTKGYEKIEFGNTTDLYRGTALSVFYRATPGLSSTDFLWHIVPDKDLLVNEIYYNEYSDYLSKGLLDGMEWHIGYSQPYYSSLAAFELAPFTSAIIIASDVLLAVIVSLVLSVIRYQKDKTVWEIFEYRVKTSEAMAHDLKTPLSTIMFYLEDLEESSESPEKVLECKNNINDKVVTMDHMIGDILMFSKSESGKADINKEELSVKDLLNECLSGFPDMETVITGDGITLTTDRKILTQVITNLLSNCDRYREKDSTVDISIGPDALTISNKTDRTYDDVNSLKKPFFKGDDSRGSKGTGLGLAIADNDLALLGYKLELSSEPGVFRARIKFKP